MHDMFLFHGHGEGDSGAVGSGYTELDLARRLLAKVYNNLISKGAKVMTNIETGYNNYNRNLTNGVKFKYNMGATIHLNSSTGIATGTEIIVPIKEKYLQVEEDILKCFKNEGFVIRGLKSRNYDTNQFVARQNGVALSGNDYYGEIRQAFSSGNSLSIIECCFINNNSDVNLFINKMDKLAIGIANAFLKEMGKELIEVESPKPNPPVTSGKKYRVITGSFGEKSNAEQRVKELKSKGYDSFIMEV